MAFHLHAQGEDRLTTASANAKLPIRHFTHNSGDHMSMRTLLIIVLVLLLLGALPTWPYSASWGYYPSGGLGLVLLIVILVALFA